MPRVIPLIHLARTAALAVAILCLSPSVLLAQGDAAILFRNAHVIVGDGSEIASTDVMIRGDEILSVGEAPILDGIPIRVIDLAGKTLMPAMIDAHAHLGYQSREGWGAEYYGLDNLVSNLRQYAYYGFSAVFSAGSDPDDLALELQSRIANGEIEAPQFLFAAGMAPPGEGPNNQFLVHTAAVEQETGMTILRGLESEAQARAAVGEIAAKGVRFVKLWVDDRGGTQTKLSPSLYHAVAEEAQQYGIKVMIHQQTAADMPDILAAGVDGFLHGRIGNEFSDAIAETMARDGVFVVPNLGLGELRREGIGDDPFLSPLLDDTALQRLVSGSGQRVAFPDRNEASEQELRAGFSRIADAGVDLVLGTDAGAVPDHPFGYTGHRELEIYVRLGVSTMSALVAATGNAAKHLGLTDTGLVKAGLRADLLILNANPLDDIRNTRRIDSVYLRGRELNRIALREELTGSD